MSMTKLSLHVNKQSALAKRRRGILHTLNDLLKILNLSVVSLSSQSLL